MPFEHKCPQTSRLDGESLLKVPSHFRVPHSREKSLTTKRLNGDSWPLFDYNVDMKTQSLADFNPYLKGRQSLAAVFARTVESSTAIEGVHLKLGVPKPTMSRRKRTGFRKPAKSSR